MRKLSFISMIAVCFFSASCNISRGASGEVLLSETFDFGRSELAKVLLSDRHIQLAKNAGPDGSNAIKVKYVGSEEGSERVKAKFALSDQVKHATLSYDVMFDHEFQWVLSGKLHGLGPEMPITGGATRKPHRWSARVTFKEKGRVATYVYGQSVERQYGCSEVSESPVFRLGEWHQVTLQVSLNDPGKANGIVVLIVDGKEIVRRDDYVLRSVGGAETLIQKFMFSTFHGGHSIKYAPVDGGGKPTDVYAYFDNFKVEQGAAGVDLAIDYEVPFGDVVENEILPIYRGLRTGTAE